jgi:hypothetical protein
MGNVLEDNQYRDWFIYSTGLITFGVTGSTQTALISIQADADFVLTYITAAPVPTTNTFLIQVTDQGSQRKLSNNPIHMLDLCGTAQRPYILPMPHRFPRNGAILLDFTNLGANLDTTRVDLHGYKIWSTPARM